MTTATEAHIVRHIIEPERLLLAWQPMDDSKPRTRRIIAELVRRPSGIVFRYLEGTEDFNLAIKDGFRAFPAYPKFDQEYVNDPEQIFVRRLPPRTRRDFGKYLNALRLPQDAEITDFALLGYSEARLPSDGFSIIHPFAPDAVPCEFLTEVAGFRHYSNTDCCEIGDELSFLPEPSNKYDPNAIAVLLKNKPIGYVNRGQTASFHHWLVNNTVKAYIEKKNGLVGRPRVMMFVEIS